MRETFLKSLVVDLHTVFLVFCVLHVLCLGLGRSVLLLLVVSVLLRVVLVAVHLRVLGSLGRLCPLARVSCSLCSFLLLSCFPGCLALSATAALTLALDERGDLAGCLLLFLNSLRILPLALIGISSVCAVRVQSGTDIRGDRAKRPVQTLLNNDTDD